MCSDQMERSSKKFPMPPYVPFTFGPTLSPPIAKQKFPMPDFPFTFCPTCSPPIPTPPTAKQEFPMPDFSFSFCPTCSPLLTTPAIATPAIAKLQPIPNISLSDLRQMCDLCNGPPNGSLNPGAAVTYRNADELVFLRHLAELALKFYNDTNSKSYKLVKVCKINCVAACYGLTFRAREDGSEECPVFRGVVNVVGGEKALFCEIKYDDGIRLLPDDDDYVSSESC